MLIAGDAAHVHAPSGGQGIGLGVQDAVNLGWKLAQVVHGISPDDLLDTYQAERHPVDRPRPRSTRWRRASCSAPAPASTRSRTSSPTCSASTVRARLVAGLLSGLDVAYDLGEGHPLLGRRMPDLDLTMPDGEVRVYTLLHAARPVLLDLDAASTSARGRTASGTSKRHTTERGSCR